MNKSYRKRLLIGILIATSVLFLAACGGESNEADAGKTETEAGIVDRIVQEIAEKQADSSESSSKTKDHDSKNNSGNNANGTEDDSTAVEPERTYRSVDEILKILNGEAIDERAVPVAESLPDPVQVDENITYSADSKTVTISEDTWSNPPAERVEFWDWKSDMSEEELAEWEAMGSEDFEAELAELEKEMAEMQEKYGTGEDSDFDNSDSIDSDYENIDLENIDTDELQKQIDEAMKQLETMEFPEGYEQYLPEGFDIGKLINGM